MTVAQQNRRLGEELGILANGQPRFAWMKSTEMPLVADTLGDVWVLCEWRRPSMTPEEWAVKSSGRWPYPSTGMYQPYMESALPFGMLPTPEATQFYIRTIDTQMGERYGNVLRGLEDAHADRKKRERKSWVDFVQEEGESFCNPLVGRVAVPQYMGSKA